MVENYKLVFDDVIIKQLKQAAKNQHIKNILTKILDKIEEKGADAGKLIDSVLKLCEVKMKSPPIRLYYMVVEEKKEAYVFEYEMKTSESKQHRTIEKLRKKISDLKT